MAGSYSNGLPPQAIPLNKKTDSWKKTTLDALENEGLRQLNDNKRFSDYYRMTEGKVSYQELSELVPQLREVENLLDDFEIPSNIKHYDLLGIILNYLETVMIDNEDKFHPTNIDEIASNEREREQSRLMLSYFKEQFQNELDAVLLNQGIDRNKSDFNSEEEKQQYQQQIQAAEKALTPEEIKTYLNKTWKTVGVEWAEHTLEADTQRLRIHEKDRECVKHYLRTGRAFKHYFIKDDYYDVEVWHPMQTFFSQTVDVKYIQYGEYVGRIHFYTPSDFINAKGKYFNEKEKAKILNSEEYLDNSDFTYSNDNGDTFKKGLNLNFGTTTSVPFENYHDHNFLLSLEEQLGVPLGRRTIYGKDGSKETIADFLPRYGSNRDSNYIYTTYLRDDLRLRNDMIMVTEAYFRSWKKVGYLTYLTETGRVESEIVTEEILNDFLKDNEIKQLRTVSLEEVIDKKKKEPTSLINTIVWDYVPEIWRGEKARTSTTPLGEDKYYNIKPLEFQIRGESNIFDLQLPVCGIVDKNPSDKIMPFQNLYNLSMNAQSSLIEKELGIFFVFDIGMLPSDIKNYGDTEVALLETMNIIKSTALLGIDTSRSNIPEGAAFNQYTVQDLSMGKQIREKQEQAQFYMSKAYEQFGVNPQTLYGDPVKYQTATGVNQSQKATHTQTDYLYDIFNNFKSRDLEMHLAVAQYFQGDNPEITIQYTKGDLSQTWVKLYDPNLPLRRIGIMSVSDSKKRRELEMMKQYMLSQNTMDMDILELSNIIASDSIQSLIELAKLERARKEMMIKQAQEAKMAEIDAKAKADKEIETNKWALQEISNQRDREKDIKVKYIDALGRAADNNADQNSLNFIKSQKEIALKEEANKNKNDLDIKTLDARIEEVKGNLKNKEEELSLKAKELELKAKEIANNKYIAEINKN